MTTEPTYGCKGCGSPVFVSLKDKHRLICPAVLANTLRQYREQHGGAHIQIEDAIRTLGNAVRETAEDLASIDTDIASHEERLVKIEDRPTTHDTVAPEGVQISGWLDDDSDQPVELPEPDEEPAPIAAETPVEDDEPTYPAPAYSTATSPAEIDDLEDRIAAQTANHL